MQTLGAHINTTQAHARPPPAQPCPASRCIWACRRVGGYAFEALNLQRRVLYRSTNLLGVLFQLQYLTLGNTPLSEVGAAVKAPAAGVARPGSVRRVLKLVGADAGEHVVCE